LKNSKWNNQI